MTTAFCIVRHGETAWNAEGRVQGQLDIPLSPSGLAQAQAVARALAGESFHAIYSSDLVRVRQTAEPTALAMKKEILLDNALRERHYGEFQGITYAEAKERFPEDYARFKAKDLAFDFRTGESLRAFNDRCLACFNLLLRNHSGKSLLVFAHGGVLDMLYRHATGRGLASPRDFEIPNAAINRLEFDAGRWRVLRWAEVAHLGVALDDLPD
ncbi:MAG: histidine phosphatase family protein [Betaproteobacteria bacterium]|nr:histidine phosphatase family protein [Betaproteobacteria bacterium]